jgi:hypothetical protein
MFNTIIGGGGGDVGAEAAMLDAPFYCTFYVQQTVSPI